MSGTSLGHAAGSRVSGQVAGPLTPVRLDSAGSSITFKSRSTCLREQTSIRAIWSRSYLPPRSIATGSCLHVVLARRAAPRSRGAGPAQASSRTRAIRHQTATPHHFVDATGLRASCPPGPSKPRPTPNRLEHRRATDPSAPAPRPCLWPTATARSRSDRAASLRRLPPYRLPVVSRWRVPTGESAFVAAAPRYSPALSPGQ